MELEKLTPKQNAVRRKTAGNRKTNNSKKQCAQRIALNRRKSIVSGELIHRDELENFAPSAFYRKNKLKKENEGGNKKLDRCIRIDESWFERSTVLPRFEDTLPCSNLFFNAKQERARWIQSEFWFSRQSWRSQYAPRLLLPQRQRGFCSDWSSLLFYSITNIVYV